MLSMNMRCIMGLVLLLVLVKSAYALTPLPDTSPGFFSGEWAGLGEHGTHCYMNLTADGRGVVLFDGSGTGDWFGARLQWRNRQQTVEVEKIIPMPTSPQLRIMPLDNLSLRTGFNKSLQLTRGTHSTPCHLQKIETTADHLTRARRAIEGLKPVEKPR